MLEQFPMHWFGATGAMLTTVCWLPQAVRLVRERDAQAISLIANLTLLSGQICWLVYGISLHDIPLIASNGISAVLTSAITAMKLKHG